MTGDWNSGKLGCSYFFVCHSGVLPLLYHKRNPVIHGDNFDLQELVIGLVYSLENTFVVSGPENGRLFVKKEN